MNDESLKILRGISLVEVMRANGYEPEHMPRDGRAKYRCPLPGHADNDPSFYVDQKLRDGTDALGWECFGCGRRGYGAIALQAAIMGYDHAHLTDEQMRNVVQRLVDDHDVEIKDVVPTPPEQRTEAVKPQECQFTLAQWTVQHLQALGFFVKNATDGEGHAKKDNGEHLFRCSIDREYWRGRGEERTLQKWGETLEKEFSMYPVDTFITGPVDAKQGGKCSLEIHARTTYPIFAMTYPWGIKKYEPRAKGRNKWYWSKSGGITAKIYGDSVAVAAMRQTASVVGGTEGTAPERPWFADSLKDRRHPLVVTDKDKDGTATAAKMRRLVLCSGPKDAMQMWACTDAHVLWLHNELAGIHDGVIDEWLRVLLFRMQTVAVDIYVCYDIDETGAACSASIVLENANVHWVRLPREMTAIASAARDGRQARRFKDVTDFVTNFHQIMKQFSPDLRKANPSEALMQLVKNALTMQFWIDKATTKKTRDGDEKEKNVRYVLSVANLLQFLDAKGIRSYVDERGQRAFYQTTQRNTYRYLDTARSGNQLESVSRTAMLDWIDAHISEEDAPFKANLVNAVFTGKGLDAKTLSTMPSTPINEHSWGEDFDYFFFSNKAVRVTKEAITPVEYSSLPYITNEECIMEGDFSLKEQPWRIIVNPQYELERKRHEDVSKHCTNYAMRAAENTRWTQWQQLWKYKLVMDKPLEQMPMHFRFLYNLGRIFWEKESFGEKLTPTEKQMQDMHFINKAHAIGYAITRHRSRASQQTVHITDYSVTDENKASGRNGKSAVIDMLASVRPSGANVAGKSMKNINIEVLMGNVVARLHTLVCIDELPDNFVFDELFNAGTTIVCRTLYKQPVTLRGDEVPKLLIASNKPFDRSGGSVKGRIYPCYTSNYYHAATDDGRFLDFSPKDEFQEEYGVQEVANNLPPGLLNELRNLLIACAQFYFQQPGEVIMPPTEARSLRRELYAMTKDAPLTDWLLKYFDESPDNPHIGLPVSPQEMAISLLDSEGESINYDAIEKAKKRIAKALKPCLHRMGIVMDPEVVLNSASYRRNGGRRGRAWLTVLDSSGRPVESTEKNKYRREVPTGKRVPRELSQYVFVHYFYRNRPGCIPDKPITKGHEHDEGYVQTAPDTDPEETKCEE